MTLHVRPYRDTDAEAVAGLLTDTLPHMVATSALVRWEEDRTPSAARRRCFVVERDDTVTGSAAASLAWGSSVEGEAEVTVVVPREHRGLGAGAALLRAAEEHMADRRARILRTWMSDEGSAQWAERRGYARDRTHVHPRLDLADLPPVPPAPAGVELRPFRDYASDPRPLYEVDVTVSGDEPTDVPADATSYADWHRYWWGRPGHDPDLSLLILVDGRPAGLTVARTDGATRYRSGITGVLPAFRGRGLAKLAKATSLHAARARGIQEAFTGNDTANAPMRAVNDWLGYRAFATEIELTRQAPDTPGHRGEREEANLLGHGTGNEALPSRAPRPAAPSAA